MKIYISYIIARIGKLLALFLPITILFTKNFDKYFPDIKTSAEAKFNLTIGGVLILAVIVSMILGELSQKGDGTKVRNPIMTTIKIGVLYGIVHCFRPVVMDIELILSATLLGQLVSVAFEYVSRYLYSLVVAQKGASATVKAMNRQNKIVEKSKKVVTPYE